MQSAKHVASAALLPLLLHSQHVGANDEKLTLTLHVSGATADTGQAICSLFASASDFLKRPLRRKTKPIDDNGRAACRFERLPAGTYAASVVYDKDGNGELNTGLFGIPTELIGMSNGARGTFGPPSFEQAAFALSRSLTMNIILGKADK